MTLAGNSLEPLNLMLPTGDASSPSIDIKFLLKVFAARWKLISIILFIALLGTYITLQIVPKVFKSTVEILIFDPQRQVDQDIQKALFPFHETVDNASMSTEIEMIRSKSLALRVAEKLGLDQDEEFASPRSFVSGLLERVGLIKGEVGGQDAGADQFKTARLNRAADAVRQHLDVQRVDFSYVLDLSATSRNPLTAQRLAAAIAENFLSSEREARVEALQGMMAWLQSRLDGLHAQIQEDETLIEKLKATSGLSDIAGEKNVSDQQIADLNTQIMLARNEVADKLAHFRQARRVLESKGDIEDIPEVQASSTINQLRLQASQLSWREATLRDELGPKHAAVVAVDNQLIAVNKAITEEAARVVGDLKNVYDIAVQREQSLEANLQSLTTGGGSSTELLKLQELQREVDADRKLYDSYLSQSNTLSTSGALQNESARIIGEATLPAAPSSPRRSLYFGFGGILGLGLAFSSVFLLEYFDRGVRTGSEAMQAFGYPVLGSIPLMRFQKQNKSPNPISLVQAIVDAPFSEFGEAIRAARLSLRFANSDQIPRAVLITSSIPGEGKSAAAMLIAASSATSGHRTVLVDCDLRRQSLSAAFGMPPRGLADLLKGTADLVEVTIRDPATGVHVIPAGGGGTASPSAADLLISHRMHELVAQLREHYDYIVLDGSPVLPVIDSLALATMVDKVLVIVEWGRTQRDIVAEALKILRPEAHRIAGIVLNKVDPKGGPRYGYFNTTADQTG